MKLNNWLKNISIRRQFALFLVLVAIVPVLVTTGLIIAFLQMDNESKKMNQVKFENQVKYALISSMSTVSSDVELISQSNAFLDYIMAPESLRSYTENRLTGLIQDVDFASQLKPSYIVLDKTNNIIFDKIKLDLKSEINNFSKKLSLGYGYLPEEDILYFNKEVKYDDQQLNGPSAKVKGYIIGLVPLNVIKKQTPGLMKVVQFPSSLNIQDLIVEIEKSKMVNKFSFGLFLLMSLGLFLLSIISGLYFINRSILMPISSITESIIDESVIDESSLMKLNKSNNEIDFLNQAIQLFQINIKNAQDELIEKSKQSALVGLASQVAHDVRSPLTALNMVISSIDNLSEDKRIIIRSAIQRINDIANDLLQKGKQNIQKSDTNSMNLKTSLSEKENSSIVMLSSLVDTLISEKRTQYRDKIGVSIEADLSHSYGLFSLISSIELKRVLSNLINNSVEALPNEEGKIFVILDELDDKIRLQIKDNGNGIPPEIMSKLGQTGVSFGKEGSQAGSGLGIHHAKSFIESIGGAFKIESNIDNQKAKKESFDAVTIINLIIPKSQPPSWFVKEIKMEPNSLIVVLDDDKSIHNVWQERFNTKMARENGIAILNFTSAEVFETWLRNRGSALEKLVFLFDYELLGQKVTGLDVAEALSLQKQTILVTSRYEEKEIQDKCTRLGIGIIPKAMATFIKIQIG